MASAIDESNYVQSIAARFVLMAGHARFPDDVEFKSELTTSDLYHFSRNSYLLRKLENQGRKEPINTADYTIEHILPQNPNLSLRWQQDLGREWESTQQKYVHTLGNLTLTGYNPEYSDKTFIQKRDMVGGFRESPLQLNRGLGQLEVWGVEQIENRANTLADECVALWQRPMVNEDVLKSYRARLQSRPGFDWSVAHEILDRIPAGSWTSYFHLAEAIGTAAQAVANHVSKCPICNGPYRVLLWNGRIADGFAWTDPEDVRDPVDVLEAEGVRFTNGVADPEQKLDTEDLLALIDA